MTYGAFTTHDYASFDLDLPSRQPTSQLAVFVAALTVSVTAGLGLLYAREHLAVSSVEVVAPSIPIAASHPSAAHSSTTAKRVEAASMPAVPPLRRYAGMLSPTPSAGQTPITFAQSAPLRARFEPSRERAPEPIIVASLPDTDRIVPAVSDAIDLIPMPAPRPAQPTPADASSRAASRRPAIDAALPVPVAPSDGGTLLEKLFGMGESSRPALAYAPVDGGLGGRAGAYDRWTAVYDIAAHTVYLPNGMHLEAHSGLGSRLDDPRSVAERMRGATPPAVYDLTLRESLFHGVRALRLTPVDAGATFGRGGLLAHTFMLGPRGDSNGCVVFRDYQTFVQAFDKGEIKRLAVVASLR